MFTMSYFSFGSIFMVKNAFRLIPQYASCTKLTFTLVDIVFGSESAQIRLHINSLPSRQRSAWNLFRLILVVSLLVSRTNRQNKENGEPITVRGER